MADKVNEACLTKRELPESLLVFGEQQRVIGEQAASLKRTNLTNAVWGLKQLNK